MFIFMTACISSFLELQGSELSERQRHHEAVNSDHQHAEKENKTKQEDSKLWQETEAGFISIMT
jgi:hypothetical protein